MSSDFKRYLNVYVFETVLPGTGETIKFKPITTGQIKKLLLYENMEDLSSVEMALDELISDCVVTEGFNINNLYLQDRFYLMLELRKATKGNKYIFDSICQKCGSQTMQAIDINTLPVKKLEIDKEEKITTVKKAVTKKKQRIEMVKETQEKEPEKVESIQKESWNLVKINDNISLKLKIITRAMQVEANIITHDLTDNQKQSELSEIMYAMSIESIITPEGESNNISLEDKRYLLQNILQSEMEKILKWHNDHDFGISFIIPVKCIHCGDEARREIPLENFFF